MNFNVPQANWCDDENLKHPFKQETVSEKACLGIWVAAGMVLIPLIEFLHFRVHKYADCKTNLREKGGCMKKLGDAPTFLLELYRMLGYFMVGLLVCLTTTQIAKYQIGRLRPYFLTVCNVTLSNGLCKDDNGYEKFVTLSTNNCTADGHLNMDNYPWARDHKCESDDQCQLNIVSEARKSFMSGHSSFSFYCAAFLIIYLHSRLSGTTPIGATRVKHKAKPFRIMLRGLAVSRPFIQFFLFMLAFYIALTRISDYRHHPMDVVTGTVVGIAFAILIMVYLVDIFHRPRSFQRPANIDHDFQEGHNGHELQQTNSQGTNVSEADGRVSNHP